MKQWFLFLLISTLVFISGYSQENDNTPEMFYEFQLAQLSKQVPINIEYHPAVKKYIDIYLGDRKKEIGNMLGLSQLYFPIFEESLDKFKLPLELKYIAVIESALKIRACSKSGALGLWQFKLNAGKMFDLEINSYVDDRYDMYKSTEAACKYLQYLYTTFNDWLLAISAYNGGPGVVRNAIARSGGKTNYWDIREYMTDEAQNYVPAFIAALYVFENASKLGISRISPEYTYQNVDTVYVNYAISFNQITEMINVPTAQLEFLNPKYKLNQIPETGQNILILPSDKIVTFIEQENKIRAKIIKSNNYNDLVENASSTENKIRMVHVVEKGEFYHKIALKYNCTVENIKAWNNIDINAIYPGQKLVIWVDKVENNHLLEN